MGRLRRRDLVPYRRDDMYMARIREATTWRSRLGHAVDYLKAALDAHPDQADKAAEEAAYTLADLARTISFGNRE
ncbi:hypothetical protein [Actinomadura violacea]|uniref:Uncharacterized protein n=1 Tax=Actinomadura violacea TaxID=2819934 RepID=A0ABS3S4U5_9ACTN|nr:hypothetical protein [Actinomadura violacea]MBO2464025.1 hypothetical protein [Actinomadura violacea]